ncbi:PAS/PAC sensor hybrid histidine kinase [Candidatus Scalindua japonica]|uniref:histidine kinase n=1 Tax=Candidatus Scalindua japonica TaxID=1284222 RepID=A0A286TUF5_9BACT|nr:response regulator [Candidatus Scalindua japonica]GAX59508.1 PAS/PAC sensor hybrid histidine kinase [Candidatus Scalindua japonica]
MNKSIHVLVVEDSEDDTLLIIEEIRRGGFEPTFERVETYEHMEVALDKGGWDVVISDYAMPIFNAPAALKLLQEKKSNVPFIIISGAIGEDVAVAMMKAGAHDYLMKDNLARLVPAIEREMQEASNRTERIQIKREIEHLASFPQMNTDPILEVNFYGMVTFYNSAACKIIDKLGLKKDANLFYHKDIKEILKGINKKNGKHLCRDVKIGSLTFEENIYLIPEFKVLRIYARDITERKQAEEKLYESEVRFRSIFEQAAVGIIHVAGNGRFLKANKCFCKIIGYTELEILERTFWDITHPDDIHKQEQSRRNVLEGKASSYNIEKRYIRKDNSIIWVNLSVSLVRKPGGEPHYFVSVVEEITERKKIQETLLQSEKLRSLGTITAGIAHDFNNILTPIKGYADIMLKKLPSSDPLYENLEHILKSVYRAEEMVKQILLFSKKAKIEQKPVALGLIVEEVVNLLQPIIPTTIEIRQRLDDSCEKIQADPSQMHQLIMNLCTNALQAMEEKGGVLTIDMKQVKIDGLTAKYHLNLNEAEYIRLTVTDTGIGMDKATKNRIFEPFFTTKAVDKGTGLGMSMVHGIVNSHHGDIHVYSSPGKGTSFHIFLPVIKYELEPEKRETAEIVCGQESILVVDDNEDVTKIMKQMLESLGYKVDIYKISIEALKAFHKQPDKYDLLISDLTMPKMTGLDLSEKIQKLHPGFPIIIITGYCDTLTKDTQREYGIKKIIKKPIMMEELAKTVREILDK